ncbi:MAG: hypothetical protein JWL79_640 [Frankiales bacterium]|jgi:hypothetical protein|nr:hypothetical protein [Frankiales bacterium]
MTVEASDVGSRGALAAVIGFAWLIVKSRGRK